MQSGVLILGGYGNFGKRIATAIAKSGIPVLVAGRNEDKASALARTLPPGMAQAIRCDVSRPVDDVLTALAPKVVVNTCGPFQRSDYAIAESCIRHKVHYVDLADGRDFVTGITALHKRATAHGVAVVSGASTVPGLSSAVLEQFKSEFSEIQSLRFGISPGQKAERGLATTRSILSYVGRPLKPFRSVGSPVYGWQDLYRQTYPGLGRRWMANCDIPDLDLLPVRYNIGTIQFSAGLELSTLHLGLWALSWLVRMGLPIDLVRYADPLLRASNWFNALGSADGGMHMILDGKDNAGRPRTRSWFVVAKNGDGPHIPTIPAIILARQLARNEIELAGAMPCVGLVNLETCLQELSPYSIETYTL